jgi:formate dehydrogenase subunit gamma
VFVFVALMLGQLAWAADNPASQQAERQATQPLNNAPVWRDVRKGENPNQVTQARGIEANVLVQSRGETWRQLRPLMSLGGGIIIALALVGLSPTTAGAGP